MKPLKTYLALLILFCCSSLAQAQSNDACDDAIPLQCGVEQSGQIVSTTNNDLLDYCDGNDPVSAPGVWFRIEGNGEPVVLNVCASFDPEMAVYFGDCETLACHSIESFTNVFCGSTPAGKTIKFDTDFDITYKILLVNTSSNSGTFTISPSCLSTCEIVMDCSALQDLNLSCRGDIPSSSETLELVEFISSCGNPSISTLTAPVPGTGTGCLGDPQVISRKIRVSDHIAGIRPPIVVCEQFFTIEREGISPVIVCNEDGGTVSCEADLTQELLEANKPEVLELECNQSISGAEISYTDPVLVAGITNCPGAIYEVAYTVMDLCGMSTLCVKQFQIENEPPVITCAPDYVIECPENLRDDTRRPTLETACGDVYEDGFEVTGPVVTGNGKCPGDTYEVTFTYTDACGRSTACVRTATIENAPPSISCIAGVVVECAADIAVSPSDASVITSCDLAHQVEIMGPEIIGTPDCAGALYVYTYTATDECGRTAICQRTFTISNAGPQIVCAPHVEVQCESDIAPLLNQIELIETSCGLDYELSIDGPEIFGNPGCPTALYMYVYTVTDACGRSASCKRSFRLAEGNAISISCPAEGSVSCYEDLNVDPNDAVVTTSCDRAYTVTVSGPEIIGTKNCPGAAYRFTYRAQDECGGVAYCEQVFVNTQNNGPTIVAPADQAIACAYQINVNPDYAEVTTSCGMASSVTVSEPVINGAPDCPGTTYTYTYTVLDECGREATDTRVVTIQNEGPELDCPNSDLFLNCEDYTSPELQAKIEAWLGQVTATSSCGLVLGVTNDYNPNRLGRCRSNPFTEITFYAMDACGRTGTCTGTIIMADTEAPEMLFEAQDEFAFCYDNYPAAFQNWLSTQGGAEAYDACWENVNWSTIPANPTISCAGGAASTTVTFVASDGCGNTVSTTATFLVGYGGGFNHTGDNTHQQDAFDRTTETEIINISNRPNPFRDETTIAFTLSREQEVTIIVFDLNGRPLQTIEQVWPAGQNEWRLQRSALGAAGTYMYQLRTTNEVITHKMILLE